MSAPANTSISADQRRQALEYCTNRVLAPRSRLSMTLRFVPERQRNARIALYALLADLSEVAERISEPDVARAKLSWWQQELQQARAGQPRHPVTQLLVAETDIEQLCPRRIDTLLAGIAASQDLPAFRDMDGLKQHCEQLGGMAAGLELDLTGVTDSQQHHRARQAGAGQYLARLLLDWPRDTASGRWWLPRSLQAEYNVDQAAILDQANENRPAAIEVVEHLAHAAKYWLECGEVIADVHLRIQRALDLRLAHRIARHPKACLSGHLARQPVRETLLAWRTARGYR